MPIYDYRCKQCGHRFEKIQGFSDPEIKECPTCGGEVEKMITAPSVQFKGSGWYATDYAKKSGGSSSGSDGGGSGEKADKPAEKKDSTPSPPKTDSK